MVPETALDHGEVVREAREVTAALRTRAKLANVSQPQSREIVPRSTRDTPSGPGKGADSGIFRGNAARFQLNEPITNKVRLAQCRTSDAEGEKVGG